MQEGTRVKTGKEGQAERGGWRGHREIEGDDGGQPTGTEAQSFFWGPRRFQQAGDPVCGVVLTNCQVFRRKARANVIGRRLQARQAAVLVFLPVFVWAAIGAR